MSKATVYLLPNLLGSEAVVDQSLPSYNKEIMQRLNCFAVENLKDARRFLVKIGLKYKIDESDFFQLNKKSQLSDLEPLIQELKKGNSIGIISDAGCPGIADPGALLIEAAHKKGFLIKPLVGPSSILLALISSGFNGQSFAFSAYLSRETDKRSKEIKELERKSRNQTQIFMETPYRNEALFTDLLKNLNPSTRLCIAMNLTLDTEFIKSQSISDWKQFEKMNLNKKPAIFLIDSSI